MTTQTVRRDFEIEITEMWVTCNVRAHSKCYYSPGRLSGPPEDCYPPESDQETTFEILSCADENGPMALTPELLAEIEGHLPVDWMEQELWTEFMEGDY